MSEERSKEPAEEGGEAPAGTETVQTGETPLLAEAAGPPAGRQPGTARQTAVWLAVLLVIVIAGVGLSPFWAPAVTSLLPWGGRPSTASNDFAALAARVTALEQRPAPPGVDIDAVKSIRSAQAALAHRVDGLEVTLDGVRQNRGAAAGTKTALAELAQRLDARDVQSASRMAAVAADTGKISQQLARLGAGAADLGDRVTALEHQARARAGADHSGAVLLLALLQMREAVDDARPFPTEYAAFKELAGNDPKLVTAAEPLAGPARDGVPSRAALRRRLDDLTAQIATTRQPVEPSTWWNQMLDRLRGLVTIRRIDGAAKTGPEVAVGAAQRELARGDLAATVSALDGLTGANAEAARPWLQMARQRLAADAALAHLQELLAARLGPEPTALPPVAPEPSKLSPPQPSPSAPPRAPS
jgi:hypothetical protein